MSILDFSNTGTAYSLTCKNNSETAWTFYMYQKLPDQPSEVFSLAWLASPFKIAPNTQITFKWSLAYNFMWANTGSLKPGITYQASSTVDCSPSGNNITTFDMLDGNTPSLSAPATGGEAGSLIIKEGASFQNNRFSTGIGMSGQGTFVQQALVNTQQVYIPEPVYYVAAANNIKMGCVLTETMSQTEKVEFKDNVYHLTATLNDDNLWSLE
jgi:hypothetical protein